MAGLEHTGPKFWNPGEPTGPQELKLPFEAKIGDYVNMDGYTITGKQEVVIWVEPKLIEYMEPPEPALPMANTFTFKRIARGWQRVR